MTAASLMKGEKRQKAKVQFGLLVAWNTVTAKCVCLENLEITQVI